MLAGRGAAVSTGARYATLDTETAVFAACRLPPNTLNRTACSPACARPLSTRMAPSQRRPCDHGLPEAVRPAARTIRSGSRIRPPPHDSSLSSACKGQIVDSFAPKKSDRLGSFAPSSPQLPYPVFSIFSFDRTERFAPLCRGNVGEEMMRCPGPDADPPPRDSCGRSKFNGPPACKWFPVLVAIRTQVRDEVPCA
jgi:hypothetical protein